MSFITEPVRSNLRCSTFARFGGVHEETINRLLLLHVVLLIAN